MCGSKMTYDGDAECAGETLIDDISMYWNGDFIRFYDSYTDYSTENLQAELQKGYMFVNMTSHGEVDYWKKYQSVFYTTEDAWELNNNGSTIITTEACWTNNFNDTSIVDCLSEAFMRNPNSGILGYIGCSVYGYRGDDLCPWGYSMEFSRILYFNLLYNYYALTHATYESKKSFRDVINIIPQTRVLTFGINPICDPEMPIFISTPLELTQTQVSLSNGNLTINTGENDCRVCVMSYDDFGESYYNVQSVNGSITLPDIQQTVSVCITKPGYLPKTYIIGDTIYIQNESFYNKTNVQGNNVLIGRDVTNQKTEGEVVVIKNSTKIKSPGGTTITRDFEVKPGAEFEISVEQ